MENLINRAKNIIIQPKTTWEEIKNEETTIQGLLVSYVFPLALISAIASFIGFGFIGSNIPFAGRVYSIEWGINQAVTNFVSLILGIIPYVLYLGFGPITKVSADKTTAYFVVSLLVIIGVYIVIGLAIGTVLATAGFAGFRY